MLAEARGYRLSLVLAHQHLGQLGPDLADGVSANARSKIFFTTSPEDARRLERHVAPRLGAHDLAHLDGYQAAARLLVDNRRTPAFTLRTRPLPPAIPGRADAARAAAARNSGTAPTITTPAAGTGTGTGTGRTPATTGAAGGSRGRPRTNPSRTNPSTTSPSRTSPSPTSPGRVEPLPGARPTRRSRS